MDPTQLRAHVDALADACDDLRTLMAKIHDLGTVGFPYAKIGGRFELEHGWTDFYPQAPRQTVTWPDVQRASHHRVLAVESAKNAWKQDSAHQVAAVASRLTTLLEAVWPEGLPETVQTAQVCEAEVHVGERIEVYVGWNHHTHQSIHLGMTGMGLDPRRDADILVDLLLAAHTLSLAPDPTQAPLWKINSNILHCHNPQERLGDEHRVRALDEAEAVLRTALTGTNALLCPTRLVALDVWRQYDAQPRDVLATIAQRIRP